jgi:phosphohistidine swiveling domain-containing protein
MARRAHLDIGSGSSSDDPVVLGVTPVVLDLDDPQAAHSSVTGAKAAALARARQIGLPVLAGFAITVDGTSSGLGSDDLREAWRGLSQDGVRTLAVRSSSTVEDSSTTSMAGHFTSVLDVRGWEGFVAAVGEVLSTAGDDPMAVLVQPMLDARLGGVLFGVDPISGRRDRILVEVVHGGPVSLVSGGVVARSHVLTTRGRLVDMTVGEGPTLSRHQRRELAHLAARTASAFGGPQDVEWAVDGDDHLWLLQSRPVTAAGGAGETGPIFGPGPVAETLPDPLSALEEDLWADPLRDGIRDALITLGTASRRALRRSPVVVSVGGLLAADLRLLGIEGGPKRHLAWLDPRDPARRLAAAWRVGRLRRAMPSLAVDMIEAVDAELAGVPPMSRLDDELLLRLLERSRDALHAVHGHEVLAGMLGLEDGGAGATAALAAVARHREAGCDDDEIVAIDPTVLALYPPRIGRAPSFPPVPHAVVALRQVPLATREALRLRARWLHEVGARAAVEAGRRLVAKRALDDVALVRHLRLEELRAVFAGGPVAVDLATRSQGRVPAPLPAAFRLDAEGRVHAVTTSSGGSRGAGGGRGIGPVHHAADGPPPEGAVLVTRTLDPGLAGVLPGLSGLVAETGSVLSHLAIVARELGVATVVGLPDAGSLRTGTLVVVDGDTGEVQPVEERG